MLKLMIVGAGGFIGAILRYLVSGFVQTNLTSASFPYGTMTVNLIGCFVIGIGGGLMANRPIFSPEMRAFIFIGILGSFTTFSTFGLESFNLIKDGQSVSAAMYLMGSVAVGIAAVHIGTLISRFI